MWESGGNSKDWSIRRESKGRWGIKKYYLLLQLCYSTITNLWWYCSTILNFFKIQDQMLAFFFFCFNAKIPQHIPFTLPNANALMCCAFENYANWFFICVIFFVCNFLCVCGYNCLWWDLESFRWRIMLRHGQHNAEVHYMEVQKCLPI